MTTIDDFLERGLSLEEEPERIDAKGLKPLSLDAVSFLADQKSWDQYMDLLLYDTDKLVRKTIIELSKTKLWQKSWKYRRYTTGMIFEAIYGRKANNKTDGKVVVRMARILSAYASTKKKSGSINDKHTNKPVYFLPKRLDEVPPYSLKLRFEWLLEQGKMPSAHNMKPSEGLKAGHAKNPRTEANIQKRSEEGKLRSAEYKRQWRAEHPGR